jgi:hypothetical protein
MADAGGDRLPPEASLGIAALARGEPQTARARSPRWLGFRVIASRRGAAQVEASGSTRERNRMGTTCARALARVARRAYLAVETGLRLDAFLMQRPLNLTAD